jgi:hypothetical protein
VFLLLEPQCALSTLHQQRAVRSCQFQIHERKAKHQPGPVDRASQIMLTHPGRGIRDLQGNSAIRVFRGSKLCVALHRGRSISGALLRSGLYDIGVVPVALVQRSIRTGVGSRNRTQHLFFAPWYTPDSI